MPSGRPGGDNSIGAAPMPPDDRGSATRSIGASRVGPRASASIRHHSSSPLPPEREAQGWTVGDRRNQISHGFLVC